MSVPPSTIFKGMLRFAGSGEQDKMDRSLSMLKPVLSEHEATFGRPAVGALVERLHSKNKAVALDAVRLFIARDAIVLLRTVPGAPLDRGRTIARTAALEWRILGEDAAADARAAESIEGLFKDVFQAVEAQDAAYIKALAERAEKEILVFGR